MNSDKEKLERIINQLSDKDKKWFALYTKYKCEKYVADSLCKKGIEAYVPLISKTKRFTRKVKHYEVPLINCYVFVYIDKSQYIPSLETEYVMKFLKQGKDLLAIPNEEINILKRVSGEIIEAVSLGEYCFESGEEVEIISGHLTGMKGRVIDKTGKRHFVVDLQTIGYQLRIQVDSSLLQPTETKHLIA